MIRDWLLGALLAYANKRGHNVGPSQIRDRPPPPAPLRPRMKVSAEALGRSRLAPTSGLGVTSSPLTGAPAFRAAPPPPGVVPEGVRPMAMDEDLGQWAHGLSGWTENLTWLGMPFLAELAQRAEYRQITETIAKEMTRRWVKVTASGDQDKTERVSAIEDALKKHKIRQKFRHLAELDGFFGRGHLYVDTGQTAERDLLKVPLILDRRTFEPGSLRGFRVVEPAWTYPGVYESMDPLAEDFYAPRTWYVYGKEVHRSRLITFVSREVPDLLKPSYQFGGVSMSQLARPYVDNWLRTRQSVSDLVHSFSTMILATDMADVLQAGGAQALFDRIELFNNLRDNRGTMALDKDREELTNVITPLGTLDHLQAQAQEQMAAVSHIPLIVLLGITPSGLNASSDGELQAWAAWVKSMQEHLFDDPLDRVIKCIQIDQWGEIDPDIGFDYEPLRELSDAERSAARKQDADTHAVYVNAGVIAPEEVRQAIAEDDNSPYAGVDLSGPPPEPPQAEEDPLGGPPDAPGGPGAPPGSNPPPGGPGMPGEAQDAPDDAASGLAAAIAARRADAVYKHWWQAHGRGWVGDAEFNEGDHPRDHGKFSIAKAIGANPDTPITYGVGGEHGGGIVFHGASHDHVTAHKVMTAAGFKRTAAKRGTMSTKLGRSEAHTSSKVQNSSYAHPEGHTATVKTTTPKYGGSKPFSHYQVHVKPAPGGAMDGPDDTAYEHWWNGRPDPQQDIAGAVSRLAETLTTRGGVVIGIPSPDDSAGGAEDAEFSESDHPRGQPGNAGEFGPGGGAPVAKSDTYETPEEARDNHGPLKEKGTISGVSRTGALTKEDRKLIGRWQKVATASLKQGDEFDAVLDKLPVYSGKIYRGLRLDQKTIDGLTPGSVYTADVNTSGTTHPTTAATFAETPYGRLNPVGRKKTLTGDIPVVFEVEGSGPYIGASTREVVLRKGRHYEIVDHEQVSQTQRYLVGGDYDNPTWKDNPPISVRVIKMKEVGQAHDEDMKPVERRSYGTLQVGIETRKGEIRKGRDWQVEMPADYGYIMRTEGADGDRVDVFVGPLGPAELPAFVVEQHRLDGRPDEHKVMIGFQTLPDALAVYDRSFSDGSGPDRRGEVHEVPFFDLRQWLRDHPMPISQAAAQYGPGMDDIRCGVCRHFLEPHGCLRVAGAVDAEGWCRLFAKKRDAGSGAAS